MNIIIQSALKTLEKSEYLLNSLSNNQLCNASIPPYYSSIGTHIRHILDFYDCIYNVSTENKIDLTARSRNKTVESNCDCAKDYLEKILNTLKSVERDVNQKVIVIDDLGLGKIEMLYTFGALLAQANSHTIHHYAIISYILEGLKINFNDSDFGYNPTTPKATLEN